MKVIILAGGFGTRLSEYTDTIPKPMAKIGDKPILWHIMKIFEHHALNDFVLALGYKNEIIKEYFSKYSLLNSDFSIDLKSGNMEMHQVQSEDWNVTLVDTGLDTMTGGRIKRLKDFVGNQTFMVTYGDGVGNIDIKNLIKFHKDHLNRYHHTCNQFFHLARRLLHHQTYLLSRVFHMKQLQYKKYQIPLLIFCKLLKASQIHLTVLIKQLFLVL